MSSRIAGTVRIDRRMSRAAASWVVIAALAALAALALAACGEKSEPDIADLTTTTAGATGATRTIPGGAGAADARVIDEWSRTLRRGDVDGAAGYFAIPSVAENGPQLVRIADRGDARLFNASLPCGARLIRATDEGDFTVATFKLTERPGAGTCGDGTGHVAQTAFVIQDGKIKEWRRVGIGGPQAPSSST
jgi:hypothetical protein